MYWVYPRALPNPPQRPACGGWFSMSISAPYSGVAIGGDFPWIAALAEEESDARRTTLLSDHAPEFTPRRVDALYDGVVTLARIDFRQAETLARAATQIAHTLT